MAKSTNYGQVKTSIFTLSLQITAYTRKCKDLADTHQMEFATILYTLGYIPQPPR